MIGLPLPCVSDCRPHRTPLAAFADGPVADTAETVTAQAGVVAAEPDRDDTDAMLERCRCGHIRRLHVLAGEQDGACGAVSAVLLAPCRCDYFAPSAVPHG